MSERASRGSWAWVVDLGIAGLVTTGYGAPVALAVGAMLMGIATVAGMAVGSQMASGVLSILGTLGALAVFVAWLVLVIKAYQRIRDGQRRGFMTALHVLVLAILPLWGAWMSQVFGTECRTSSCDPGPAAFRVFAQGRLWGLLFVHSVTALAFVASRRRPERLPGAAEAALNGLLLVGAVLQALVAVQVADLLWGLVVFPVTLPLVAPFVAVAVYLGELVGRLRRRGGEALRSETVTADAPYRSAPEREVPATEDAPVHGPTLAAALAAAPALAGAYAVAMAAVHGRPAAAVEVFTSTCGHALSKLPVEHIVVHDCHYLCTVAARGTPGLVRPERMGVRNGHPIVVNRQLAVANAFEDLLHTRWPRFGRLARRVYDRLGLPVSRYITRVWMADAVYVAMKPLEWAFYATLLVLDRDDPERRIGRMYRSR